MPTHHKEMQSVIRTLEMPLYKAVLSELQLRIDKGSRAVSHVIGYNVRTIYSTVTIYIPYERKYVSVSFDINQMIF